MKHKTVKIFMLLSLFLCFTASASAEEEKKTDRKQNMIALSGQNNVSAIRKSPWKFTDEEEEILAHLMMAEAEGEGDLGKIYVLQTVLNRMKSKDFPNTVEGVVFQKVGGVYQYSPVEDGRLWDVVPDDICYEILADAQSEYYDDSQGILYFCESRHGSWHRTKEYVFTYKNHSFYR